MTKNRVFSPTKEDGRSATRTCCGAFFDVLRRSLDVLRVILLRNTFESATRWQRFELSEVWREKSNRHKIVRGARNSATLLSLKFYKNFYLVHKGNNKYVYRENNRKALFAVAPLAIASGVVGALGGLFPSFWLANFGGLS